MESPDQGDSQRLALILELVSDIERRLDEMDFHAFSRDKDEIDLTAYRLSAIGETTKKLSSDIKDRHPHIPWRAMYGMRNVISHEYGTVIPRRVWDTARDELHALTAVCRAELERLTS